jgi:apolipoprotein N-acyltransferase
LRKDVMTQRQAETVANVVLTAAAIGAAYYVLRTPPLRRLAFQMARRWAMGPLAVWAATEVRRAWDESGHPA